MNPFGQQHDATGSTTTITKRNDPCNCGCQGKDPWHQARYRRVLHEVQDKVGTAMTTVGTRVYTRTAVVQLPWGRTAVVYVPLREGSALGEWLVVRESMLDQMNKP